MNKAEAVTPMQLTPAANRIYRLLYRDEISEGAWQIYPQIESTASTGEIDAFFSSDYPSLK